MGSGESKYVQDQERFVRENMDAYKKALPNRYSNTQVKGKLRQLYANTDMSKENKYSYIMDYEWNKAKQQVIPKYASIQEKKGGRRYYG